MNIRYLLSMLIQRLWLIGAVALLAALLAYWLVGRQPDTYQSQAILATGIINYKGISTEKSEGFVQEYMINNAFSNLTDFAVSRSTLKLVQIALTRHDLEAQYENIGVAMRQPNRSLSDFNDTEGRQLLEELKKVNLDSITELSFNTDLNVLLTKVAIAYGYDHDALLRQNTLQRKGQTDYLVLTSRTESPALSAFMANTYADVFIRYYRNLYLKERRQNYEFYNRLATDKRKEIDSIQQQKFDYLYKQGLPSLGTQSQAVIGTLTSLEDRKRELDAEKQSAQGTIMRLDQYLAELSNSTDKESVARISQKVEAERLDRRINELSRLDAEAKGGNAEVRSELEKTRKDMDNMLNANARSIGSSKPVTREALMDDLYRDKINTDLRKVQAESQISRLDQEIVDMRSKLGGFVLNDAVATSFEEQQKRAEGEFAGLNEEMIKAKLDLENAESPLVLVETAQNLGFPEPKNRALISALAGVVGAIISTMGIVLLAFMDRSIRTPDVFLQKTGNMHILSSVARVTDAGFDVRNAFHGKTKSKNLATWQEHVRKLRNAIKPYEKSAFLFVSPHEGDGKTFIITSLAYAITANHQRVLILDTNFKSPMPSVLTDMPSEHSEMINGLLKTHRLDQVFVPKTYGNASGLLDVLGHHPTTQSPSEVLAEADIASFLDAARAHYDYIFIEASGMNDYADAREMLPYAHQVIAVFDSRKAFSRSTYETIAYLKTLDNKLIGSVLNQVDPRNIA
ncbi:MAG: hypothetical protein SFV52_05020 [Saprospiraceae bacterium]|nr:hypothetical protein [Saprospiraceae bacterium]